MRIPTMEVVVGQELPDWNVFWYATPTTLVDLSVSHTYELKVVLPSDTSTAIFTTTTGLTGAAGSLTTDTPNLGVAWSTTGELNSLTGGNTYLAQLKATRTSDSKVRIRQFHISALAAI